MNALWLILSLVLLVALITLLIVGVGVLVDTLFEKYYNYLESKRLAKIRNKND